MYPDVELDQIIASLAARSDMMAFVLDGRLDPLAELFGLVNHITVPSEKRKRLRILVGDLGASNAEIESVRGLIARQLPLARSGSEILQLRQANAMVDRLHQSNIRLSELIIEFLARDAPKI